MPRQPKPNPVGRPKLPKGEAKGSIVPVRFNKEDRKRVEAAAKAEMLRVRATPDELKAFDRAAKAKGQKRSEWIREVLNAATQA